MKSQNEIILETEMLVESSRKEIEEFKGMIFNQEKKEICTRLEHTLFEFIVFCYTHRTIWNQPHFWLSYATTDNPQLFINGSYEIMLKSILTNFYSKLYFLIEGALCQYFSYEVRNHPDILKMYRELSSKFVVRHYEEIDKGLQILRCVRNSFHGSGGNFIFMFEDEEIYFKGTSYSFIKGELTAVSYEFIRGFVPYVVEIYKFLFKNDSLRE